MKFTAIFLLAACLTVSAGGYSQKVTLNEKNVSLQKVFREINRQTGFQFFYKDELLNKAGKLDINVTDAPLEQVLELCFKNLPINYRIVDKTIVVTKKEGTDNSEGNGAFTLPPINVKGKVVNENGEPVTATIAEKGTRNAVASNAEGYFELKNVNEDATLVISGVNIETYEVKVGGRTDLATLTVKIRVVEGETITINTGYQVISKERITGSIVKIDNELLNRRVGPSLLDRINGIAPGVLFTERTSNGQNTTQIRIRGESKIPGSRSNAEPLIVVDNFPYEGNIENINPNDVEDIAILKDAAAASIWGARAGNGVIVITTKKGKYNQKMRVTAGMTYGISTKPDLKYDQTFLKAVDFIEVEKYLFTQGYYDYVLSTIGQGGSVSPVVEILDKQRRNLITVPEMEVQINKYKAVDARDEARRHLQQRGINQQYSLNMNGGSEKHSYYFGIGYNTDKANVKRNESQNLTLTSTNSFRLVKNLELTTSLIYNYGIARNNAIVNNWNYTAMPPIPYFKLADDVGNPAQTGGNINFLDSLKMLGYLDGGYYPLKELRLKDNKSMSSSIVGRAEVKYSVRPFLNLSLQYQIESATLSARNLENEQLSSVASLINQFAQYNSTTRKFTYPFPRGGILRQDEGSTISNGLRGQVNFAKSFGKHEINAITGAELREIESESYSRASYGYNDEYGTAASSLNFNTAYPTLGGSSSFLPALPVGIGGNTRRYLSYYTNVGYSYETKYTLTLSGRKEGSNIFGVRTNERVTPLWSVGGRWSISREKFYKFDLLKDINLRASYGYNGNVYTGAAYLIANFGGINAFNIPSGTIQAPPNSELRWEKIKNVNIGFDYVMKGDRISGSIDLFQKKGEDLIDGIAVAPQSGWSNYIGNNSSTRTNGFDISVKTVNLQGKINWTTSAFASYQNNKVVKMYLQSYLLSGVPGSGRQLVEASGGVAYLGKTAYGIYSYKWAGLSSTNGDPQGYIGKNVSTNYSQIMNSATVDSINFHGSAVPALFGGLKNDFKIKNFSLSFNITYRLGYYFKKPTLVTNYQQFLTNGGIHHDYVNRWQKAGDELKTNVPSLTYATNDLRSRFFQFSEVNVHKGDHIRLQDIRVDYKLPKHWAVKILANDAQVYFHANGNWIIWKANKAGLDPQFYERFALPNAPTYSFGIRLSY